MSSVPERSEVAVEYTWDLEDLFADDEEWEAALETARERVADLETYEGRVTEDAETLAAVLEARERAMRQVADVVAYARMRSHEDTTDGHYQALATRAQSLAADAASAASFVEPELQACDRDELDAMVEAGPDLATYEHYFEDVLRMKPHTRSPEVEELLADLSEVTGGASEVYEMLTNADMTFPAVETPDGDQRRVTLSNFTTLQQHADRGFRRRVYEAFYDEWAEVRNAVGTAYRNAVTADVKLARARNYGTAREAALDGANVPVSVYDTLVEAVRDHLGLLHRHAELKADRLGVDELAMWDLYAPVAGSDGPEGGDEPGDTDGPEIGYEQAKTYVTDAVAPLGEAYRDRLAEGLESRWVDVYETANKRSGAYSGGTYDSQPYILLNYQGDVSSMFTLAHELGHSMHSELASETQPYVYSDYDIFTAEVASTVNEALLTDHLLSVGDDHLRRHVLDEYLERVRSTLFRQTMFADFEHRAHGHVEEGGALTPDWCDETYRELKAAFYEPASIDDRIAREWMRIPHFYNAFYVYQYATGITAATALVEAIHEEGEPAAERYRQYLRAGGSDYPLELLAEAGVDMTTAAPIERAMDAYERRLEEFVALD